MEFNPPISERETDELIEIANDADRWSPMAMAQAREELLRRNVSAAYEEKKLAVYKRYNQKKRHVASSRKANEAFEWHEFVFGFHHVLIEMLCDWDMKKNGYLTKHRQRKYTLSVLAFLIVSVYVYWHLVQ